MFHLTRYKWWFFGISLAVILPGLLALIFWGLNLGIDFTGGAVVEMRFQAPASKISTGDIATAFRQVGGQDVHVYVASDLTSSQKQTEYVYITFDRPIGPNTVKTVTDRLNDPKANLGTVSVDKVYPDVRKPDGKEVAMMVVHSDKTITADAVQAQLKDLPPTDVPVIDTSATPTPNATASGTATPNATATATPTQTFPVSVTSVLVGENNNTYRVETKNNLDVPEVNQAVYILFAQNGPLFVQNKSTASAAIGAETTRNAIFAVIAAAIAIMFFIAYAFRHVGTWRRSFRFGVSAIIALLHDVLVVLGIWAILGHFFDFKVDSLFLTAVLTVVGFSVHDTIVVFDRIRENLSRRTSESFETIVDASLIQTMARSINTSFTVLLTLTALVLFGGASIREFTLALLIGILSGTYSSIFNASMILTVWETGEWRTMFRRGGQKAVAPSSQKQLAGTRS
ncbi:MAG TPA: protein translocase subunit SecF [Ktedonobacterales bacterium]